MEGKGLLKTFADIDVFDIEVDETDPERFIDTVVAISKTFGGINLEDIKAPECFEIERRIAEATDIPVMHDDQHGTAIISAARSSTHASCKAKPSRTSRWSSLALEPAPLPARTTTWRAALHLSTSRCATARASSPRPSRGR